MTPPTTVFTALFCVAVILTTASCSTDSSAIQITDEVSVIPGPVNGVRIEQDRGLLAVYGDPREDPPAAEQVLFTHHRRDVTWAGRTLVERGATAVIPAAEKQYFSGADEFWDQFQTSRFHDYAQQGSKVLAQPLSEGRTVSGGDRIEWGNISIEVLDTAGYTRGAVSYVFEAGGRRIACVGDLIYGDGLILDIYSLQDAIPEVKEGGYHGYAARTADVVRSLRQIAAWKPDVLIPARGPVIENPQAAIDKLLHNLRAMYKQHFTIDALRWYRGDDSMRTRAARVLGDEEIQWMPMAETLREHPPKWIIPIRNSRLIISDSGAAFLVDCGSRRIMDEVKRLHQQGRFKTLEGIYVTHYHDDHTDMVQAMADEFNCPVFACQQLRDILEHPGAYRLPCGTMNPIREITVMGEGEKKRWHEFEFTYSYYPGQTLYHGGLLVAKNNYPKPEGQTVFFVGDSFTPTGIDDYCLLNRNLLRPGVGFLYCLNVLKGMEPDYLLLNQHVEPVFRFSGEQIDLMIQSLNERIELMRGLFPWGDVNYGLDERWARFYPYGIEAAPGEQVKLKVVILNHSPREMEYRVTPHVPEGWLAPADPLTMLIPAGKEGEVSIPVTSGSDASGLSVITADVAFGPWDLREWTEAMVTIR